MELKWISLSCLRLRSAGSNRTFMELKLAVVVITEGMIICSNRTFMELKSRCSLRPFLARVF